MTIISQPSTDSQPTKPLRSWLYVAGGILSLICLYYFARRAMMVSDGLLELTDGPSFQFLLAVIPYMLAGCASAWAWWHMLNILGVTIRPLVAAGIFFAAQFGKYIPGNVAQHIGRVALSKRYGLPVFPVLASMSIEIFAGVGIMLLFSMPVITTYIVFPSMWIATGIMSAALLIGLLCLKRGLRHFLSELLPARLGNIAFTWKWSIPLAYSFLSTIMSGVGLLLLDPIFITDPFIAIRVISIFCAAWVAGYITPGAPAGLGIRELILSEGLTPIVGIEGATIVALLLRAVTIIADLIAFGIGLLMLRYAGEKAKK